MDMSGEQSHSFLRERASTTSELPATAQTPQPLAQPGSPGNDNKTETEDEEEEEEEEEDKGSSAARSVRLACAQQQQEEEEDKESSTARSERLARVCALEKGASTAEQAAAARWPPWKQLTPQEYCVRSGILNEYLIHSDHQRILLLDSNLDREIDWAPQIPESVLLEAAYETRLQYEKSEGLKKGHFYFSNSRRFMTDWDHK